MTTLSCLSIGDEATLVGLGGARPFRRRLLEMGLLPGTRIRLVRKNALHDVLEVEVRRSHVTLRTLEAGELFVTR